MKMKVFFVVITAFILAGCKTISDDFDSMSIYVYKNATDKEISVNSYLKGKSPEEPVLDISFRIPPKGEYDLVINRGIGTSVPFQKKHMDKRSHLVISNGGKQLIQYIEAIENFFNKTLYSFSKYKESKDNDVYIFTYTFTDEDFKNAKPIEQ